MLWSSPRWDSVTYWALDLETGGLDPRRDPIIAAGMVPVRAGVIRLGEAWQSLVRPEPLRTIAPASMRAHQLVPQDVRQAPGLAAVVREIDARIREGALLVHQAGIDVPFLKRAYRELRLRWPGPKVVDTVALLLKEARRSRFLDPGAQNAEPELRLREARRAHGLPDTVEHDALSDAVAAAELFLAIRSRLEAATLRDLL